MDNPGTSWIVNEAPSGQSPDAVFLCHSAFKFSIPSFADVLILIGGWPAAAPLEDVGLFGWFAMSHGEPVP